MKINVAMPQLGESVSEGEVIRWLKKTGDPVRRDEALIEVKTDKATVEIPAPSSGTLSEILVEQGGTVQVGANIATIESTSESAALAVESPPPAARKIEPPVTRQPKKPAPAAPEIRPATQPKPAKAAETAPPEPAASPAAESPPKPSPQPARPPAAPPQQPVTRPQMTPLARRIAGEFGLDPSKIQGTGEGGRITREDVLNARAAPVQSPNLPISQSPNPPISEAPAEPPAPAAAEEDEIVPLTPIRRRIAARLVQSAQTIPRVTTAIEADLTALAELRKQHRESYEKQGVKLTCMPFIMKAAVAALKASPAVNSSWAGENLIRHKRIHLGVAVSVESGLVVPVIRNADDLTVRQLAERLRDVADHARAGKLTADEVRGSTFTITNPGLFGAVFSTPIINPPEAAILAVCRIADTPVVRQAKIVIRQMMNLCLSYDHRIIDGEPAIRFLQQIRAPLEAAKFEME